jgi:hypothetical protein
MPGGYAVSDEKNQIGFQAGPVGGISALTVQIALTDALADHPTLTGTRLLRLSARRPEAANGALPG